MSARAQRDHQPQAYDSEWLEFPDRFEISPASVWASDYEDETTVQSKRVAAKPTEQVTADKGDEPGLSEARPQARILDESQVLPSEASFATVKLYQQVEQSAAKEREQFTTSGVESTTNRANSRTRTLDVSHVLPGEASYATVMLQTEARTHSPLREFFAKSSLNWGKLTIEALLLVSVSSGIVMVAFKTATQDISSSHTPTASTSANTAPPEAKPTATKPEMSGSEPVVSVAVSNQQTQVKEAIASAPQKAALEAAVEVAGDKISGRVPSEGSRKAASDDKVKMGRKIQPEAKSGARNSVTAIESKQRRQTAQQRPAVKESEVSNRAAPTKSVGVKYPEAQIVGARRDSSPLATDAAAAAPKGASTTVPVTGGGQRPRTVRPKENP